MKKKILITLFLLIFIGVGNAPAQSEKNVSYGILLDNTGSMALMLDNVKNVGKEIVAETYQKGLVSVYGFRPDGAGVNPSVAGFKSLINRSQDRKKLEAEIDSLHPVVGKTLLFEAIESAGKKISAKDNKNSEKILILITDGDDRASSVTETEVINNLKAFNIKVYAIGLVNHLPLEAELEKKRKKKGKPGSWEESKAFLIKIANETGGRAVFPKEGDNIREIIKNLLAD